jgi:hypothetical protein
MLTRSVSRHYVPWTNFSPELVRDPNPDARTKSMAAPIIHMPKMAVKTRINDCTWPFATREQDDGR